MQNGLSFAELPEDGSPSSAAGKKPVNTKLGTIQLDLNYLYSVDSPPTPTSPVDAGAGAEMEAGSSSHEPSAEPS